MLDVHPPHAPTHTWSDFFLHIATICIGLLIAIGLEQSVEAVHRHHQRIGLEADLRTEAANNREIIARDLNMRALEPWFEQAAQAADSATPSQGKIHLLLPAPPCLPGSVGTSELRYFAPSQAVWTTAKESSLVPLLPVEQARMYGPSPTTTNSSPTAVTASTAAATPSPPCSSASPGEPPAVHCLPGP